MSSTESSGAPAEASATTPAPAAFPTFGSTRGSGLARGKRPAAGPAASTAASTEYTPTAIEVVNAPREYQNPFAPAETPAAVPAETMTPAPVAVAPAPAPVAQVAPVREYAAPARREHVEPMADAAPAVVQHEEPAELNILEPEQPKAVHAQTWESEGFRPNREPRTDRPRREERAPRQERSAEPVDLASIPEKFLYVRPGYNYVPTPSNYGGAPRERSNRDAGSEAPARSFETAPATEAPVKSGGFFGWLKSLFGGSSAAPVAAEHSHGEHRPEGGQRRHRGGRTRGGPGGCEGGRGRGRGGRGRSGGGGGYRSEGSSQGGV
ncbi:MAG: translation initiation factor IF-2 [bacterium]|nr:translation initiation factor IF-2 [bacterium]